MDVLGTMGHPLTETINPQLLGVLAAVSSQLSSSSRVALSQRKLLCQRLCLSPLLGSSDPKTDVGGGWGCQRPLPFQCRTALELFWSVPPPVTPPGKEVVGGTKPFMHIHCLSGEPYDCGRIRTCLWSTCLWIRYLKGWDWKERINLSSIHLHMNSFITMSIYCFYNIKSIMERNVKCSNICELNEWMATSICSWRNKDKIARQRYQCLMNKNKGDFANTYDDFWLSCFKRDRTSFLRVRDHLTDRWEKKGISGWKQKRKKSCNFMGRETL